MPLSDKHAEIVSYQLFAYQEVSGTSPSTMLWKKVGDVMALPLPMACTLTQVSLLVIFIYYYFSSSSQVEFTDTNDYLTSKSQK